MVWRRQEYLIIAVFSALCSAAAAQVHDQPWESLNELTHRASLIFATKEGYCVWGSLKSVGDTSVTVKLRKGTTKIIQRPDLLRVNRAGGCGGCVLFSNRSSWRDVTILPRKPLRVPAKVRVETKAGENYDGTLTSTSDDGLTFRSGDKSIHLQKSDIALVSYIVPKPASDSAVLMDEEGPEVSRPRALASLLWSGRLLEREAV
jgi:small nuclear ribonucleoprotein (snRNP)-like protein